MKKILSLLSILTISATAIPVTIGANTYQKQENVANEITTNSQLSYNNWSEIEFGKIKNIENNLKQKILGQDYAICKVKIAVNKAYFNFNDNDKPAAKLFFSGPTGVGKTYFVKNLANEIFGENYKSNKQFITFDMSNYNAREYEKQFVTKLLDFDDSKINILLFDEIEKSNPEILDKFLQILDKAKLNTNDREINFSKSFIIFTSNIGSTKVNPENTEEKNRKEFVDEVSNYFQKDLNRPELLTRIGINNIIPFNFMNETLKKRIIEEQIKKLKNKIIKKFDKIEFEINNEIDFKEYIFSKIDTKLGTRGIEDTFENLLVDSLTEFVFESKEDIDALYNMGDWNIICDFKKENNNIKYFYSFKPKKNDFSEKDYEFLAHDDLNLNISYYSAKEIKYFLEKLTQEQFLNKIKNKIKNKINLSQDDKTGAEVAIITIVNFIWNNKDIFNKKLEKINNFSYISIKTNTIGNLTNDSFSIKSK